MRRRELDEEDERLRLVVELALQDAGGILEVTLGSWKRLEEIQKHGEQTYGSG